MTTSPKTTKDETLKQIESKLQASLVTNKVQTEIMALIREALAQPAADDKAGGEVVAKVIGTNHLDGRVRWVKPNSLGLALDTLLYTRPRLQAERPAERVALSNEQVTKVRQWLWANHAVSFTNDTVKKIFEVGHGITAKDQS